jgi:ABC-type nickel/cobalt efflux system permease component RcnA
MKLHHTRHAPQHLVAAALSALLLIATTSALAAPGAHGPNGEHLDAPSALRATSALPRVEAKSESFELVAELRASELAIFVDRFESNEPVVGAQLELESGSLKAVAAFRAEQGDYAVTDAAMLKALAAPGEHGLVFTLVAGKDSDLLDGTLVSGGASGALAAINDHDHDHDHEHGHAHGADDHDHELERTAWIVAGVAALGLIGGIAWWRQSRRTAGKLLGGL